MTPAEARDLVVRTVLQIAPDLTPADLREDAHLQDDLQLDSLDFLSFVEALGESAGLRIEEDDYPELATIGGCTGYLAAHRVDASR